MKIPLYDERYEKIGRRSLECQRGRRGPIVTNARMRADIVELFAVTARRREADVYVWTMTLEH
jgi:hypothetical protein